MASVCKNERFYEVVWPLMAVVLRMANYLSLCTADAEDLAQETMLKAFKSLDHLQSGSNTKAWLLTILRNTHIDRCRARAGKELSLEQLEYEPAEPIPWEPREQADV